MADWRVLVLGIAQDGGVPHAGCDQGACALVRRGERRPERVACLGLTDGERAFLFDATPDLPDQLHALGARAPEGIFLTHAHMGHYTGLVHLGTEAMDARGVRVFGTAEMRGFLRDNAPWSALVVHENVRLEGNAEVHLDGVRVRSFRVPHRDEFSDTVGYRVDGPNGRVLYVPDVDRWEKWDRDVRREVAEVDVALLDGTFYSAAELPGRDMSRVRHPFVTESMDRLHEVRAKVWFTHLNHTNPLLLDPAPVESRGFHVAREGLSFLV